MHSYYYHEFFLYCVLSKCVDMSELFSLRATKKIIQDCFADKKPVVTTFYIKYGPPASGKADIMDMVLQKEKVEASTVITVDVDAILATSTKFNHKRTMLFKDRTLDDTARTAALQEVYQQYRSEADDIAEEVCATALQGRYNIAWETTGNSVAWTVKTVQRVQRAGYRTVVVYPLVPINTLIERGQKRAKDTKQITPRADVVTEMAKKAARNVLKLLDYVDVLYIYDNAGAATQKKLIVTVTNVYTGRGEVASDVGYRRTAVCDCSHLTSATATIYATELLNLLETVCDQCKIKP